MGIQINRIKAVLAETGHSNSWLANKISKNPTTISRWCTNDSQPTLETLYQIAQILNVDIRDLLNKTK